MYHTSPRFLEKNRATKWLKKQTKRISTFTLALGISFLATGPLVAADEEVLLVGGFYNNSTFNFSNIDANISNVDRVFGYQVTWLQDQGEFYWEDARLRYGAHYYRVEGGSGSFMLTDGYDAVAEILYGDMKKVVQKRPFWEKLWYRAGVRLGIYRWVVLPGSAAVNINDQGFALSFYLAVGLGRLGAIEFTQRSLLTGAESASAMSNTYISYVYEIKL